MNQNGYEMLISFLRRPPQAQAVVVGNGQYATVRGNVRFYQIGSGVLVLAEIAGLPRYDAACESPVFGFHIHEGGICAGNADDPFADAGAHYNPHQCPHPYHAGDLPPLFGTNGYAFSLFLTDRFTVEEILGKTVIIHSKPDDFTTQPSGNAGSKIACGVIVT